MRIRIDIVISPRVKRVVAGLLGVVAVGAVGTAHATWQHDTSWIASGEKISATKLGDLWTEADARLVALEQALADAELRLDALETPVAARYVQNSGLVIPTSTQTKMTSLVKEYDTHGGMNAATGEYTCPLPGLYRVSAAVEFANNLPAAGAYVSVFLFRDTTFYANLSSGFSANAYGREAGSTTIACDAGHKLSISIYQESGATKSTSPQSVYNYFSVERVAPLPP